MDINRDEAWILWAALRGMDSQETDAWDYLLPGEMKAISTLLERLKASGLAEKRMERRARAWKLVKDTFWRKPFFDSLEALGLQLGEDNVAQRYHQYTWANSLLEVAADLCLIREPDLKLAVTLEQGQVVACFTSPSGEMLLQLKLDLAAWKYSFEGQNIERVQIPPMTIQSSSGDTFEELQRAVRIYV